MTGHCGPKAFRILSATKVPIYLGNSQTMIQTAPKESGTDMEEAWVVGVGAGVSMGEWAEKFS